MISGCFEIPEGGQGGWRVAGVFPDGGRWVALAAGSRDACGGGRGFFCAGDEGGVTAAFSTRLVSAADEISAFIGYLSCPPFLSLSLFLFFSLSPFSLFLWLSCFSLYSSTRPLGPGLRHRFHLSARSGNCVSWSVSRPLVGAGVAGGPGGPGGPSPGPVRLSESNQRLLPNDQVGHCVRTRDIVSTDIFRGEVAELFILFPRRTSPTTTQMDQE